MNDFVWIEMFDKKLNKVVKKRVPISKCVKPVWAQKHKPACNQKQESGKPLFFYPIADQYGTSYYSGF